MPRAIDRPPQGRRDVLRAAALTAMIAVACPSKPDPHFRPARTVAKVLTPQDRFCARPAAKTGTTVPTRAPIHRRTRKATNLPAPSRIGAIPKSGLPAGKRRFEAVRILSIESASSRSFIRGRRKPKLTGTGTHVRSEAKRSAPIRTRGARMRRRLLSSANPAPMTAADGRHGRLVNPPATVAADLTIRSSRRLSRQLSDQSAVELRRRLRDQSGVDRAEWRAFWVVARVLWRSRIGAACAGRDLRGILQRRVATHLGGRNVDGADFVVATDISRRISLAHATAASM